MKSSFQHIFVGILASLALAFWALPQEPSFQNDEEENQKIERALLLLSTRKENEVLEIRTANGQSRYSLVICRPSHNVRAIFFGDSDDLKSEPLLNADEIPKEFTKRMEEKRELEAALLERAYLVIENHCLMALLEKREGPSTKLTIPVENSKR